MLLITCWVMAVLSIILVIDSFCFCYFFTFSVNQHLYCAFVLFICSAIIIFLNTIFLILKNVANDVSIMLLTATLGA